MEKITFSLLKTADIEEVLEIEKASFSMPWTRGMFMEDISRKDMSFFMGARFDKKLVGYGGFWLVLNEMHLGNIAVHPDFRRQGIGEGILKKLIELGKSKGANLMTLEVRESNRAARALYEKTGLRIVAMRKGYYADTNENAYIYIKDKL